eukprot:12400943-Karenia_brevis.AAC.1
MITESRLLWVRCRADDNRANIAVCNTPRSMVGIDTIETAQYNFAFTLTTSCVFGLIPLREVSKQ